MEIHERKTIGRKRKITLPEEPKGCLNGSFLMRPSRVLVISPHTDDAEVSSGGSISRFLREGRDVFVLVLSSAFARDSLAPARECVRALERLGIKSRCRTMLNFPVRRLGENRQEILDEFVRIKRVIDPDLILLPSTHDFHQDHQVVANEGLRAFKDRTILGYEYPWNHREFHTTAFIRIEDIDLDNKIAAIAEYESQRRPFMEPELIRAWAITRGVAVGTRYAESFEVVRQTI